MIKAVMTWGAGPDVLMVGENVPGHDRTFYVDLTADEALRLSKELRMAANRAKEMDKLCQEHDEGIENEI